MCMIACVCACRSVHVSICLFICMLFVFVYALLKIFDVQDLQAASISLPATVWRITFWIKWAHNSISAFLAVQLSCQSYLFIRFHLTLLLLLSRLTSLYCTPSPDSSLPTAKSFRDLLFSPVSYFRHVSSKMLKGEEYIEIMYCTLNGYSWQLRHR